MPAMNPLLLFKCLNDETRLRIVLLLQARAELCVCDLIQALQLSQPKVSRHLQPLREGGLLLAEKRGQWVYYRLSPAIDDWAKTIIDAAAAAQQADTEGLLQRLGASCC